MHVQVNGTRLWFDVEGVGLEPAGTSMRLRPTVLLLHGGPGSFDHAYFKPDFAALSDIAQVVYLDLPGHGRSDWGAPEDWRLETCADLVAGFCEATGIERPVVLGHSLGGFVAILVGARHPRLSAALVLQSTMARLNLERVVAGFRRVGGEPAADTAARFYGGRRDTVSADEWSTCWRLFGPNVVSHEQRARTLVNAALGGPGLEIMRRFDLRDQLARIEVPALVCTGELDPITDPDAAREIAAGLSAPTQLELLEACGHFPWLDDPNHYWPLLRRFVTETGARH